MSHLHLVTDSPTTSSGQRAAQEEIERLLQRLRRLVVTRAMLAVDGASEAQLAARDAELAWLRARLARIVSAQGPHVDHAA